MRQQVNLYQPMFRRRAPLFSARALARSALLLLVSLGGLYAYAAREVAGLEAHVAGMEAQRQAAQTRLLSLEQSLPAREPSRLLAAEVQRLAAELARSEALVTMLSDSADASAAGFSAHLEGLARQRVDGLWLTGIGLSQAGREVRIRGSALDAAMVPVLVQRLGEEPAFAGLRFAALTIERANDEPSRVDFVLRTRLQDEDATDGR